MLKFFLLQEINHPFLVDLTWSSKDKSFLYMLFPYVSGGELFSYLRRFNFDQSFAMKKGELFYIDDKSVPAGSTQRPPSSTRLKLSLLSTISTHSPSFTGPFSLCIYVTIFCPYFYKSPYVIHIFICHHMLYIFS